MQTDSISETRIGLNALRDQLRKPRSQLKGRQTTPEARAEVQGLIGLPPLDGHRRDLLIEHLHVLNDHFHGLFERHIVALAAASDQAAAAEAEPAAGGLSPLAWATGLILVTLLFLLYFRLFNRLFSLLLFNSFFNHLHLFYKITTAFTFGTFFFTVFIF